MKYIIGKKQEAFRILADAKKRLDDIRTSSNGVYTQEEQKRISASVLEDARGRAGASMRVAWGMAYNAYTQAAANLKKIQAVDPTELSQRATILGQQLKDMGHDELLRVYDKRFSDRTDRVLIEQIAQLRIDSGQQSGDSLAFADKWDRLKDTLKSRLPDVEKVALREMRDAELKQEYAEKAEAVLDGDFSELAGDGLNLMDAMKRTEYRHRVNTIEGEYTEAA